MTDMSSLQATLQSDRSEPVSQSSRSSQAGPAARQNLATTSRDGDWHSRFVTPRSDDNSGPAPDKALTAGTERSDGGPSQSRDAADEPEKSGHSDAAATKKHTANDAAGKKDHAQASADDTAHPAHESKAAKDSDDERETSADPLLAWLMGLLVGPISAGAGKAKPTATQDLVAAQKRLALPHGGKALPLSQVKPDATGFGSGVKGAQTSTRPDPSLAQLRLLLAGGDASVKSPLGSMVGGLQSADPSVLAALAGQLNSGTNQLALPVNPVQLQSAVANALPQFDQQMGQNVVWMMTHGVQDARLRVTPDHLGPIDIHVKMDGDSARVSFHSAHAQVRDALVDAAPRLRQLLGGAGLGLAQVDVGAQGSHSGQSGSGNGAPWTQSGAATNIEEIAGTSMGSRAVRISSGLIDTFV